MSVSWSMTSSEPLIVAAVVLSLTVTIAWMKRTRRDARLAKSLGCEQPGKLRNFWPLGLEHIAHIQKLAGEKHILQFFVEVAERVNKPTFHSSLLGQKALNTVDFRNIEALLSTQFQDFGVESQRGLLKKLFGDGIFTQDGAKWKHSRALLRPHFAVRRTAVLDAMRQECQAIVDPLHDGQIIDLQPLFFQLTLHVTLFFLFGPSWRKVTDRENTNFAMIDFETAFGIAQEFMAGRGHLNPWYWRSDRREFRAACELVHEFMDDAIDLASKEGDKNDKDETVRDEPFLQSLRHDTSDRRQLRDQLLNILIAGRDTTACTLSWTFRMLATHPAVLHKLVAEIDATLGMGPDAPGPDRDDLKRMPYLHQILKEVLRLYPAVPVNSRKAVKTTTLPYGGGADGTTPVLIKSGEEVAYYVYVMHRRKDLYGPDADEFRPERWDPAATEFNLKDIGWAYLPFNGGPRICLGQEFALQEASYTIVKLLQAFPEVTLPVGVTAEAPGSERQRLGLVLAPEDGCVVQLRRTKV